MELSSFAIAFLANLDESERAIALESAEDYLIFKTEEIAVIAGFWKASAHRLEGGITQLKLQLEEFAEAQRKIAELDSVRDQLRDAKDLLHEKMVAYGYTLIEERKQRKNSLVKAGVTGAKTRNVLGNDLKAWALKEAAQMKGLPAEKARELMKRIPAALQLRLKSAGDKLKNPERVIRDALAAQRNKPTAVSQADVTAG